jgi:hypothetical protein
VPAALRLSQLAREITGYTADVYAPCMALPSSYCHDDIWHRVQASY